MHLKNSNLRLSHGASRKTPLRHKSIRKLPLFRAEATLGNQFLEAASTQKFMQEQHQILKGLESNPKGSHTRLAPVDMAATIREQLHKKTRNSF